MKEEQKIKTRDEVEEQYQWDLSVMYQDEAVWEADLLRAGELAEAFSGYAGKLKDNMDLVEKALDDKNAIWLLLDKVYVYARMKKDEDNTRSRYQAMSDKAQSMAAQIGAALSFLTPELMEIDPDKLREAVRTRPGMKVYAHLIDDMLREREHILTQAEERLLAQFSEVASAPGSIFRMINNADMTFEDVMAGDGGMTPMSHGKYIGYLESTDRKVRESAFRSMYGAFGKQRNTIASTYHYSVKSDVVSARVRKYPSALDAALSADNIPQEVYTNLIETVHSGLDALHRYVDLRKKALKLDEVRMYDMYTPIVKAPDKKIPYEEGVAMIKKALAPLGREYLDVMEKGFASRWIDVYENKGKTSGAYSFGCYDSPPYILLNYQGKFKDVSTVAHEMGHSMHSWFTRTSQPFVYGGHSIFTAEVASTVNESLLMRHMIDNCADEAEKAYLLNVFIEEFRGTFFRQTMFAEFEKLTHEAAEAGEALTEEWLSHEYGALNQKYFGPHVTYDDEIMLEWARIPHFYNSFYVYKYATGYSAAIALSEGILKGGEAAKDAYIDFLRSGDSAYPIELLKRAGVDMSSPVPIQNSLKLFRSLVEEMERLI